MKQFNSKDIIEIISLCSKNLQKYQKDLNKINNFPVSDKDTGDNLVKTFSIELQEKDTLIETLEDVTGKILMSSRGSSGNIIVLYFLGIVEALKAGSSDIKDVLTKASKYVDSHMYNPKEGTILTTMRCVEKVEVGKNLASFFKGFIREALEATLDGPKQLEQLKNTPDSGAVGFVIILDSIFEYITTQHLISDDFINMILTSPRYCVELLINNCRDEGLESKLKDLGTELFFIPFGSLIKIHIHTNNPEDVLNLVKARDDETCKIEDLYMRNLELPKLY